LGFIIPNMGTQIRRGGAQQIQPIAVADALFTKVQQRVLGLLFGNPDRSYYANEVIGLAASGTGAVQRELTRLEAAGLVSVSRAGNQKHYRANVQSPVYPELRGLVLKTSGLVDVLRAAIMPLASAIPAAFVFGSVAKGEDSAQSDIDLMVVSDTLSYADLYGALETASNQLGRTVNPTLYSRQELRKRIGADNAFVKRVLGQPKLWVFGDKSELPAR
jgi:predicted nucleotidyltransferase